MSGREELETRNHWTVQCSWCGHQHRDVSEMVDYQSEEWREGECAECEKPIRYRVHVSHTYICEPMGDPVK